MQIRKPLRLLPAAALLLSVTVALTACWPDADEPAAPPVRYGRDPVERDYEPPVDGVPPAHSTVAGEEPAVALARIAARLAGQGFTVTAAPDGSAGLIVKRSGDPLPYVDCGSFILPSKGGGSASRVPAALQQASIPVLPIERNESQQRQLRLDARIAVTATPSGGGSELVAQSIYVVTRTIDRIASDGGVTTTSKDTISFGTLDIGRFPMGLECMATGRLEADILGLAPPAL